MIDADLIKRICQDTKLAQPLDDSVSSQTIEEGLKFTISKTQENCQLVKAFKTNWDPTQGEVM